MGFVILFYTCLLIYANQLANKGKRFQESNKIEQLWRYRFYLAIPFLWLWYSLKGLKVYEDKWGGDRINHTNDYHLVKGKNLWKLLIGIQQGLMKWYYTSDEVFDKIKNKKK